MFVAPPYATEEEDNGGDGDDNDYAGDGARGVRAPRLLADCVDYLRRPENGNNNNNRNISGGAKQPTQVCVCVCVSVCLFVCTTVCVRVGSCVFSRWDVS